MKLRFLVPIFFIGTMGVCSQETDTPRFGKGLFNLTGKDSTWSMKVGARVQLLATSFWNHQINSNENGFLVRRARLKADGFAFSPKLEYKFELGLSNRDMSGTSAFTSNAPRLIMDAVVKWNFHKNLVLWFGQTKLPGNRERVISSANLQLVDRSLLNSRFNIDRDVGLQLHNEHTLGKRFVIREILSLSQGEGRNVTTGNLGGFQYVGRIELLPFGPFARDGDYSMADLAREPEPKFSIAGSYEFNNNAVRTRSNMGSYMTTDLGFYETNINTTFIDAMFKYRGISFMGEYAIRDAEDPFAKNSDGTATGDVVQVGKGLNLQAGYLFKSNWEIAARFTSVELDEEITSVEPVEQYTIGVSKYLVGHKLKIQSDVSRLNSSGNLDGILARLQFELHF